MEELTLRLRKSQERDCEGEVVIAGYSIFRKRRGKGRADEEEEKKKNPQCCKEEKKDPAEYPAGFSYSWNCAGGHGDCKNK